MDNPFEFDEKDLKGCAEIVSEVVTEENIETIDQE